MCRVLKRLEAEWLHHPASLYPKIYRGDFETMKQYPKTYESGNSDRIQKAITIIYSGTVRELSKGLWSVPSSSRKELYVVSAVACQCEDYQFNGGVPCKHQWASSGATAALIIMKIRQSHEKYELELCARHYSGALVNVPEPFLSIVRSEYRARLEFIDRARQAKQEPTLLRIRLNPGRVFATRGAWELLTGIGKLPWEFVGRHLLGDWGDMCHEDKRANEDALKSGARIFSSYLLKSGEKVWVITEADRSATTVLLPSEY